MINVLPHSDNKVEEVHFNMALLSLGDRGALCHKEKMSIRNRFQEENNIFKIDEEVSVNLHTLLIIPVVAPPAAASHAGFTPAPVAVKT